MNNKEIEGSKSGFFEKFKGFLGREDGALSSRIPKKRVGMALLLTALGAFGADSAFANDGRGLRGKTSRSHSSSHGGRGVAGNAVEGAGKVHEAIVQERIEALMLKKDQILNSLNLNGVYSMGLAEAVKILGVDQIADQTDPEKDKYLLIGLKDSAGTSVSIMSTAKRHELLDESVALDEEQKEGIVQRMEETADSVVNQIEIRFEILVAREIRNARIRGAVIGVVRDSVR